MPPGKGVVEGNEIPYKPEALAQKKKNYEKRDTEDPGFAKCLLPGVPRATYMPYPFEIIQNPQMVGIRYQFARAVRTIDLAGRSREWLEGWPDFWMGDSRGKWEGDTLVVDVRKLTSAPGSTMPGTSTRKTCTSSSATPLSIAITFNTRRRSRTRTSFTRPWKISMPLYRIVDKNAEVFEWDCRFDQDTEKYKDAIPK